MAHFTANPRDCSITTVGKRIVPTGVIHNDTVVPLNHHQYEYNVMPLSVPGLLASFPLQDDGDKYLNCGPIWALTANHIKFRHALVTFIRPPRIGAESDVRAWGPNQDVYLVWIPSSVWYFMDLYGKRSDTVDFIEVGSVVGSGIPVLKPFKFLEAFTLGVWLLLAGSVIVLGFLSTLKVNRKTAKLRCVRSPRIVMLQFMGLFLGETQRALTEKRKRRKLRLGVIALLFLSFMVLMNAFQGSLWTLMGLAFKPLVVESLLDLLNPEYADWPVISSVWLPEFYHLTRSPPDLIHDLRAADRLFLMDWEEVLRQGAHMWGALFVGFGQTFALISRRFIMHIIWLACQLAPSYGIDRDKVNDAITGLHISAPIAAEPFFIFFNDAIKREVVVSYSRIFTLYWQSGLIAHWFSQEDSQIENVLRGTSMSSGLEMGSSKGSDREQDSYSEPVFEQLHPRDLAGACLVLIICLVFSAVSQLVEWALRLKR